MVSSDGVIVKDGVPMCSGQDTAANQFGANGLAEPLPFRKDVSPNGSRYAKPCWMSKHHVRLAVWLPCSLAKSEQDPPQVQVRMGFCRVFVLPGLKVPHQIPINAQLLLSHIKNYNVLPSSCWVLANDMSDAKTQNANQLIPNPDRSGFLACDVGKTGNMSSCWCDRHDP